MLTSALSLAVEVLSLPLHRCSDPQISILKTRPHYSYPQIPSRLDNHRLHSHCSLPTHTQTVRLALVIISIDLWFEALTCVCECFCAFASAHKVTWVSREPLQRQSPQEKEIPTPDPLYGSLPLSPHWHTLGDCGSLSASNTTFSTQHCQPSSSFAFLFLLAALFAWGKWAVDSQA